MSYLFPDYPHYAGYDQQITFLIEYYKKLTDSYKTIEYNYVNLTKKFNEIENEFNQFKPYIDNKFSEFKSEYEKTFAEFVKNANEKMSDYMERINDIVQGQNVEIQKLYYDMEQFKNTITSRQNNFEYLINTALNNFRAEITNRQLQFESNTNLRIDGFDNYMKLYVQIEFDKCLQAMMKLLEDWQKDFPPVINPINGQLEGINKVLNDIWNVHVNGITVNQLIESNLKVQYLVDSNISIMELITKGYDLLYWQQPWKMYSPFNGRYVDYKEVIYDLANLHKTPTTIDMVVNWNKSIDFIIGLNKSVYEWVWNGGVIIAENS